METNDLLKKKHTGHNQRAAQCLKHVLFIWELHYFQWRWFVNHCFLLWMCTFICLCCIRNIPWVIILPLSIEFYILSCILKSFFSGMVYLTGNCIPHLTWVCECSYVQKVVFVHFLWCFSPACVLLSQNVVQHKSWYVMSLSPFWSFWMAK